MKGLLSHCCGLCWTSGAIATVMNGWIDSNAFVALFPDAAFAERELDRIAYLTADREFIGKEWLSYLLMDKPITFWIRSVPLGVSPLQRR